MADDVTLVDGANATFVAAADQVGGKYFQRVKLTFGIDGVADDVSVNNKLPIADSAVKGILDSIKDQNDKALTHLTSSDAQMAALIAALGSVVLAASTASIGAVTVNAPNGTPVATNNRFPVATAVSGTPTTRSTTITSGGVAQQLAAANTSRAYLCIQNQDAAVDLYVSELGTAVANQTSLKIPPGQLYEWPSACVPIGAISVLSSKTGHLVFAREL